MFPTLFEFFLFAMPIELIFLNFEWHRYLDMISYTQNKPFELNFAKNPAFCYFFIGCYTVGYFITYSFVYYAANKARSYILLAVYTGFVWTVFDFAYILHMERSWKHIGILVWDFVVTGAVCSLLILYLLRNFYHQLRWVMPFLLIGGYWYFFKQSFSYRCTSLSN